MPYCNSCGVLNCYEVQIDRQCPLMVHYVLAYSFSFSGFFLNVKFYCMCNHSMQNFCMHRLHRCYICSNVQYTLGRLCVRAVTHQADCRPSASGGPLVSVCCSVFHTSALVSILNRQLGWRRCTRTKHRYGRAKKSKWHRQKADLILHHLASAFQYTNIFIKT